MAEKDKPTEKLVKATVAPRRSIDVPFGTLVTIGTTEEGKPITRIATKSVGPGETVELPASEVEHLRKAGFLVDETAPAIPVGAGPTFGSSDGPQVKAAG
jgi:hypothetical protein